MQGVTTFVGGTCGDSPAPQNPERYARHFWEYDVWPQIDGHMYYPEFVQPREKALPVLEKHYPIRFDWRTFGEYLDKIERQGTAVNFIPLLGHSTIRSYAMGRVNDDRRPTEEQMKAMKHQLEEAMEAGAWGISTGLDYVPSAYATTEELVEIVRAMERWDGIYSTHWRRTGIRRAGAEKKDKSFGLREACEIGHATGMRVQISHLSTVYDIFPSATESLKRVGAEATLAIVDEAERRGVRVAFDVITNTTAGFECIPYLCMYLAPWVRQAGSVDRFIQNLGYGDYRTELKKLLASGWWYKVNRNADPFWEHAVVVTKSKNPRYDGRSIQEIAGGRDVLDTLFDLLIEDPLIKVHKHSRIETYIDAFMSHPLAMPSIDGYIFDANGHFGTLGPISNWAGIPEILPNPNAYCGFVKCITDFAPRRLEEKIRKMTGWPAEWTGIKKRGLLREGYYADIVVLDMENLRTNENHERPNTFPSGIEAVVVNGSWSRAVHTSTRRSGQAASCA